MTALGSRLAPLLLGLLACAAASRAERRQPRPVRIANFAFVPAEITVRVGDTVAWTNEDAFAHTATADSAAWSSPDIRAKERFAVVPRAAGRYPYHCAAHPVMRGIVIVTQ